MIDKVYSGGRVGIMLSLILLISGCSLNQTANRDIDDDLSLPVGCDLYYNSSPKKVAILHIGLDRPEQSQYLPHIQKHFAEQLLKSAQQAKRLLIRDASHITVEPLEVSPLGQVDPGIASQMRQIGRQFDSQLVLYGSFTEIGQTGKSGLVDKIIGNSKLPLQFTLHFFDGISGQLIHTSHLSHTMTAVDEDTTENLMPLVDRQMEVISRVAECTPLTGRVTSADNTHATINLGSRSRISRGDLLDIYHAELLRTDAMGVEHTIEKKVATLWITQVQSNSATGQLELESRSDVVLIGDRVVGR